jgi:16S rRNA (cytosine967-C5)-methyltransferase
LRIRKNWTQIDVREAELIAKLGRSILGWKTLREVESVLGFLLTRQIEPILKTASDEERIGLQTFHPTWFVNYCINLFGRNEAIAFLDGDLNPPPTSIRLNTLKGSPQEILQKLSAEGVTLEKTEPLKYVYKVVTAKKPLTSATVLKKGLFFIQDKASAFAAEAADPKPTSTVLDVCAAPGAKTTYLAQLMLNQGSVYSIDYSIRRMRVWKKEVSRMGVTIAAPIIADATDLASLAFEADVVVLDPPCTSTGAFGKFPSTKWRITFKSIARMAEIQKLMINACAEKVKQGGVLIYSTCSITIEENELVVEQFLKDHPEFFLAKISPDLGLPGLKGLDNSRRLYPHIHESTGFFVAKLQKQ